MKNTRDGDDVKLTAIPGPRFPLKRVLGIVVSVTLIVWLLWHVDAGALFANFQRTRWGIFSLALAFFIPQILVIAWRWKRLVTPFTPLKLSESVRLVLAGSSMNLLLPGKLGDLIKGWFLAKQGHLSRTQGLGVVAFEKMLDVAALAVFMLGGVVVMFTQTNFGAGPGRGWIIRVLLLPGLLAVAAIGAVAILYFVPLAKVPGYGRLLRHAGERGGTAQTDTAKPSFAGRVAAVLASTHSTMNMLRARGSRRGEIIVMSIAIWVLHLAQIYLFFLSVNAAPKPGEFFGMVPLAIFLGLIPISMAGFGTRDAAFVMLLPSLPASAVLAGSFYVNLRYILPAIAGVPYLARYTLSKGVAPATQFDSRGQNI